MVYIIIAIGSAIVVVISYQLFRVSNLMGIARGKGEQAQPKDNNTSALLLLVFMIGFLVAFWWYFFEARPSLLPESASVHGSETDRLFYIAMGVILVPFTLLNFLLFFSAYKFRYRKGQFARFYPENHKLEIFWTVVPGVVFTGLVLMGANVWGKITSEAPEGAEEINIMGYQFAWAVRYPGGDGQLGRHDYRLIDAANPFGLDLSDAHTYDDFSPLALHVPKGKPVLLHIMSKDVIHSVFMPHFRLKMDAVPGMPTKFWFVPKYTTEEMREITGNAEFNYELACTEICGRGHFAMRLVVVVDEPEDYQAWKAQQVPWLRNNPGYLDQVPEALHEAAKIKSGLASKGKKPPFKKAT